MNKYPLIVFTVLFICGIVLKSLIDFQIKSIFILWAFLLAITFVLFVIKYNQVYITSFLLLNILISGVVYSSLLSPEENSYPFEKNKYKNTRIVGKISNIELLREGKIVFEIESDSIVTSEFQYRKNTLLLCTVYEKSKKKLLKVYDKLLIGGEIIIIGSLQKGKEERNPGEFNYQKYLEAKGISALINCYKINDINILNSKGSLIDNIVFSTRKLIDENIHKYHNENSAALLRGLLLADRSEVDYETRQSFVNAGVIHVLAVSGLHVGFIILIFVFLFGRLNIIARYLLTIIGLICFLIITGSPASVFRASVMACVLIVSFLTNRSYNSINSISLAALIIQLINPQEIFNPGFQLSFSAVLSILILYPVFQNIISKYRINNKAINYLLLFISVSLAAQIGTLPFTLIYFNKISIISLFTNLFVIPSIGFIVGIGIFTLFVSSFWPWLAAVYAISNDKLIDLLFEFVKWSSNLEFSYLSVPGFSKYDTIIFYVSIILFMMIYKKLLTFRSKIFFTILIISNYLLFTSLDDNSLLPENKLSVIAIDVGQGDAILIKFPNGETALIDAGNATTNYDNGERVIKPLMENLGIKIIDYGFISHLDADHSGGYISLISNGLIKEVYKSDLDSSLDKDIKFEKFVEEMELKLTHYEKRVLSIGNCRLYVLNNNSNTSYNSLNINDKSGILKLVYGETSFLFTGDAGIKSEKILYNEYDSFLNSDVLKLGHHGSKTSTSELFLSAVTPDYAIISAGIDNIYKHPSREIIDRLNDSGVIIKRTDFEGAIVVESDGNNIEFIQWKNN